MKTLTFLTTCLGLTTAVACSYEDDCRKFNPSNYASEDVITRDVAVIGGGSSGTYGAINLREMGQSVELVEKQALLGGHVNTYTDPVTGAKIDYGVQAFWNISVVPKYFAHFDIPLTPSTGDASTDVHVDFRMGNQIAVQTGTNFTAYGDQLEKYPYLLYSWNLPYPIPTDLLLPFSEFITKYNLQDVAYSIYFNSQGLSNILQQLTINVFKIFDESNIDYLAGGDVTTLNHDNGELYSKALAELGSDALLSSTVVSAQRPDNSSGVRLVVQTPSGNKLIMASKLLVSIPPLLDNMSPFDLDARESRLFSQWNYSAYYTMLINNTGLPSGYRYLNANAMPTSYNIPDLPAAYQVTETSVPGTYSVWYGSPYPLEQADVEADVTADIQRLRATTNSSASTTPEFVAFKSHTPFKMVVSAEAISGGFYKKLEGLQGHRNTWYTGAAFLSHSSAELWNFTHALLPQIIAAR